MVMFQPLTVRTGCDELQVSFTVGFVRLADTLGDSLRNHRKGRNCLQAWDTVRLAGLRMMRSVRGGHRCGVVRRRRGGLGGSCGCHRPS